MHLLHYLDDIRPVDEISELRDLQRAAVDNKELLLEKLLVENLSNEHFGMENGYLVYTVWVIDGTYNFQ